MQEYKLKYASAISFLIGVSAVLSNELSKWINTKKVRLLDHTVVVRKEITGASSIFEVIDDETTKVDGVSTIKGNSLNKNEAVIFDAISLAYGTNSESGKEGAVSYGNTSLASLNNANFVLTQNGRIVLDLPVSNIMKPNHAGLREDEKFTELTNFAYLVDDQPMEWRLRFPSGVGLEAAANDAKQYLEVKLKGLKTLRNIA